MSYTDFGLFSCHQQIGADVNEIFMQLTGLGKAGKLHYLWQSPFTLHSQILAPSAWKPSMPGRQGRRASLPR
jgi:polyphosphate kinase